MLCDIRENVKVFTPDRERGERLLRLSFIDDAPVYGTKIIATISDDPCEVRYVVELNDDDLGRFHGGDVEGLSVATAEQADRQLGLRGGDDPHPERGAWYESLPYRAV